MFSLASLIRSQAVPGSQVGRFMALYQARATCILLSYRSPDNVRVLFFRKWQVLSMMTPVSGLGA